ncbi:MAG: hypothetical protein JRJ70_12890 [Deltaproteobacteria bacterium]|nr:hypothetical protein [Deltaproteobacteria bacterium]
MKPHLNKRLFSNYYLEELLPREEEFKLPLSELGRSLEEIKRIWDKKYLSSLNEPQLRKHFLDKVFEILGWTVDVEPPTPSGEWSKHPDYALFDSKEDLKLSQEATKEEYFKNTLCLGEAKRWGRPLDKKIKVDPEDPQNPSLQISRYLWLTEVKWGILTDGRRWRLYERETSKRLDIFYEIDLEDLIETGSVEDFKYFYLFFRRHAFPAFLEKVYKESVDYAEAVGEELKENIYHALKTIAQGFLKDPENGLKEIHLKEIHDNSLILLYRLLFILYAEYRGLLPVGENQLYTESYSLDVFKKEIADKLDRHEPIATSTHGCWNKLKELFEIINIGNPELGVPPYNGGLFDPDKYGFLERYRVGDLYIVKAVDLLSRSSDRAYIDYGSLEIRHLGSIYEGLLEYKLKIAEDKLVPVKEKGKEVFIPFEEAEKAKKKIKEDEIVREGEIYLVTDKGERKATGSYYTPDYIVNYIIDNTLGPLVQRVYRESKLAQEIKNNIRHFNEIFEEMVKERGGEEKENLCTLWNMTRDNRERRDFLLNLLDGAKPSHEYDPLERILQLKILDPAMGSGHFLVEATDFLARELLKVLSGEPLVKPSKEMVIREAREPYGSKEPEEEDIRWARREVVERCIFGVDLNPLAVELAKLSLWLYTVAKDRPLNFLDHHLRCGNSLIGAKIDDLVRLPALKKKKAEKAFKQIGIFENAFREKVGILLKSFELIEALPSDTVQQIREKEMYYQDFRRVLSRFQDVADVWTSIYFGIEIDFGTYQRLQNKIRSIDEEWDELSQQPWFREAKVVATEKKFFHWELEFPQVFFEGHQRQGNPGFDIVVGNPPWGGELDTREKEYLRLLDTDTRIPNSYIYFMKIALNLLKRKGRHSFVIPDSILVKEYPLSRQYLLLNCRIEQISFIHNTGLRKELQPFPDVNHDIVTLVVSKQRENSNNQVAIRFVNGIVSEIGNVPLFSLLLQRYFDDPELDYRFNLLLNEQNLRLKERVNRESFLLRNICETHEGIHTGNIREKLFIDRNKVLKDKSPKYKKLIIGASHGDFISRYHLFWNGAYVNYDQSIIDKNGKEYASLREERIFLEPKLFIVRTGDEFFSVYDGQQFYASNNLFCMLMKDQEHKRYNLQYVQALLNGKFLQRYLRLYIAPRFGDLYTETKIKHLDLLPIHSISFTTTKAEREVLVEDLKKKYTASMLTEFLALVDECLPKDKQGNFLTDKGKSDVVHDILAYLAEQMIELNKKKEKEAKGFIEWLEGQLKTKPDEKLNIGVEVLSRKTQIKDYLGDYQKEEEHLPFEEFWIILEKNKSKIQANLKTRETFDAIKTEYKRSLSKLLPLKEKLRKTDWLIDQIVYKLYGLSQEEIRIVEGQK